MDCRVDKSNRRLSFAACLLLAAKVNESNSMIAYDRGIKTKSDGSQLPLMTSWVKPNRKSGKIFESLIVFFTHDWSLSLKQLYAAEWIVFTALGFSLKAQPSDVAFHFRRLLRVLEWNPRSYLGAEMYRQWQESLLAESARNERRQARREARIQHRERKLLKLQRKIMQQTGDATGHASRRSSSTVSDAGSPDAHREIRRHSIGKGPKFVGEFDASRRSTQRKKSRNGLDSPGRMRNSRKVGILSRLSRPKPCGHGKELHKVPKLEEKATLMKPSASLPMLSSLDLTGITDSAVEFVCEGDVEENPSDEGLSQSSNHI